MEIDPCPVVVSLKNGSKHTLFEFRHFLELVDQEMGMDAARWLESHVNQLEKAADYVQAKIDTDLPYYEDSLSSNTTAFMDIKEEISTIIEITQSPRMNRQKIVHAIREIEKIINNQI